MPRYFTHYWTNETWERGRLEDSEGMPLEDIFGKQFRKRRVSVGDIVYVVTVIDGELYLCSRMAVGRIHSRRQAHQLGYDIGDATDLLLEEPGTSTLMYFDRKVPLGVTKSLRFVSRDRPTPTFDDNDQDRLDQQTFRTLRELTGDSARKLDKLIDLSEQVSATDSLLATVEQDIESFEAEETYIEGKRSSVLVMRYEREPKLRAAAIRIHGTRCQVCGFSFGAVYGLQGEDFIQVHHKRPLSSYIGEIEVDPREDMAVLCSNCHSMIHRKSKQSLSVEELRQIYLEHKQ